jgi:hypothetical protein
MLSSSRKAEFEVFFRRGLAGFPALPFSWLFGVFGAEAFPPISLLHRPSLRRLDRCQRDQIQHERDHKFVWLDLVLEMWRSALGAIRTHIQDQALVKLIVADVLRFLPAPLAGGR